MQRIPAVQSPWAKFSLPGQDPAYARGYSREFRSTLREIFGPLVEPVKEWPSGTHAWLMAEVPGEGSLAPFFRARLTSIRFVIPLSRRPAQRRGKSEIVPGSFTVSSLRSAGR